MNGEKKFSDAGSHITETKPYLSTPSSNYIYNLSDNIVSHHSEKVRLDDITDDILRSALLKEVPGTYFRNQGHSARSLPDGRTFYEVAGMGKPGTLYFWEKGCKISEISVRRGGE